MRRPEEPVRREVPLGRGTAYDKGVISTVTAIGLPSGRLRAQLGAVSRSPFWGLTGERCFFLLPGGRALTPARTRRNHELQGQAEEAEEEGRSACGSEVVAPVGFVVRRLVADDRWAEGLLQLADVWPHLEGGRRVRVSAHAPRDSLRQVCGAARTVRPPLGEVGAEARTPGANWAGVDAR